MHNSILSIHLSMDQGHNLTRCQACIEDRAAVTENHRPSVCLHLECLLVLQRLTRDPEVVPLPGYHMIHQRCNHNNNSHRVHMVSHIHHFLCKDPEHHSNLELTARDLFIWRALHHLSLARSRCNKTKMLVQETLEEGLALQCQAKAQA
jgi:hypothetical protein